MRDDGRRAGGVKRRLLYAVAATSLVWPAVLMVAAVRSRKGESFQCYYFVKVRNRGRERLVDTRGRILALGDGNLFLYWEWSDMPIGRSGDWLDVGRPKGTSHCLVRTSGTVSTLSAEARSAARSPHDVV